ncbi:MAG TPA: flippase [Actinobacteria bacterium]|nr:polysaccharide biosynthesis protein [bacterium BMS3Bbin01]HDH26697.1 flippase [Actinomycetota bacterium]
MEEIQLLPFRFRLLRTVSRLMIAIRTPMNSGVASTVNKVSQVLVLRSSGAALALASGVVMTRLFGAASTGTYFLALVFVGVGTTLGRLGTDLPTMKLVAAAADDSDWSLARGIVRKASWLVFTTSGLLTAVLMVGAPIGNHFFLDVSLPTMIRLTGTAIVPSALLTLRVRALTAVGQPRMAEFLQRAGFQMAFIALIFALFGWLGVFALGTAFSVACWVLFAVSQWQWSRAVSSDASTTRIKTGSLLRPGLPLLLASSIWLVIGWTDTLMIGYFMTPSDVGVYGAAIRSSATLVFVLVAAESVVGPRFATLYANGEIADLSRLTRRTAQMTGLMGLPLLVLFVAAARPIMGLFGPEFTRGSATLTILSIGQFFNAATGVVAMLLAMSGHERRLFQSTGVSAICNVVLDILLIPRIGIEGAAIASAFSLIVINTLYVIFVRRDLGISVITDPTKRLRSRVRNRGKR